MFGRWRWDVARRSNSGFSSLQARLDQFQKLVQSVTFGKIGILFSAQLELAGQVRNGNRAIMAGAISQRWMASPSVGGSVPNCGGSPPEGIPLSQEYQ
jgi:hypothetical protein